MGSHCCQNNSIEMFSAILFLVFYALPIFAEDLARCQEAMTMAGASEYFASHVSHAIHSMTVEDLKMFEPSADVTNHIPTVNKDLDSSKFLLASAPERESTTFKDRCMRAVDEVMTHLGQKWAIAGFDTVDQILHSLHMLEVWSNVLPIYDSLKRMPVDAETCRCVVDLEQNGINMSLRILAYLARSSDPNMVLSDTAFLQNSPWTRYPQPTVQYYLNGRAPFKNNDLIYKPYSELLRLIAFNEPMEKPRKLKTKEDWRKWKEAERLINHVGEDAQGYKDAALYLHCALRT